MLECKSYHKKLQEIFPELKDSEPVDEWENTSFNDGGSVVTTIWEGPGRHTRTRFNDLSLAHPDTSIQVVEWRKVTKWVLDDKGPLRTYGCTDE